MERGTTGVSAAKTLRVSERGTYKVQEGVALVGTGLFVLSRGPGFPWTSCTGDERTSICLSPVEKNENMSSSDRFPLKPTGENNKYS